MYPMSVQFSRYRRTAPGSFLNELLNFSRKNHLVRDDVASIRINHCTMPITVNFARADHSFVDVCLPALDHSMGKSE